MSLYHGFPSGDSSIKQEWTWKLLTSISIGWILFLVTTCVIEAKVAKALAN
jgi:hypothetical protein